MKLKILVEGVSNKREKKTKKQKNKIKIKKIENKLNKKINETLRLSGAFYNNMRDMITRPSHIVSYFNYPRFFGLIFVLPLEKIMTES